MKVLSGYTIEWYRNVLEKVVRPKQSSRLTYIAGNTYRPMSLSLLLFDGGYAYSQLKTGENFQSDTPPRLDKEAELSFTSSLSTYEPDMTTPLLERYLYSTNLLPEYRVTYSPNLTYPNAGTDELIYRWFSSSQRIRAEIMEEQGANLEKVTDELVNRAIDAYAESIKMFEPECYRVPSVANNKVIENFQSLSRKA